LAAIRDAIESMFADKVSRSTTSAGVSMPSGSGHSMIGSCLSRGWLSGHG
jgi:hypothetical protein